MRYPNCEKTKAFKFFDQGKRPAEIFKKVNVKPHTLFNYFQDWKKERQRKRFEEEQRQKLEEERTEKKRQEEEAFLLEGMEAAVRRQREIKLEKRYKIQLQTVLMFESMMGEAADKPDNEDDVHEIGELYTTAYDELREITRQLYPDQADEESIAEALGKERRRETE